MFLKLAVGIIALWTVASGCIAQPPERLVVCDFDEADTAWRSKFSKHEVIETERDGQTTRALRHTHDLSQPPNYDWVRGIASSAVDARPYKYLNVRIRSDNNAARLTAMLMQTVPVTDQNQHGEKTASAGNYPIVLAYDGWKHWSLPLSVFSGFDEVAANVNQFNFAYGTDKAKAGPGEIIIDDLTLSMEPEGELVPEQVPYPPADVAVKDEAEFFSLLNLDLPALAEVRKAVQARDWDAAKQAWATHLETRQEPRWTWSHRDKAKIMQIYEERGGGMARYASSADTVLARDFNWLGVRKKLDKDIQWLQGPWEWTHVLSRHAYWKDMGYAYWGTGKDIYAEDWVYMLRDWIADNPVPRVLTNSRGKDGTVWRTLETGIRTDVWFDIMELFMDAPQFDAEAKYLMTRSLVEQARHLHRYTTAFRFGNWQVVECTGLACVGIMLPEFKEAEGWRERAFEYLVKHMERDVYPDGAHHEVTPGYHGWVMERFLKAATVAKINGYEIPGLMDRHEKMFEFLMHVSKPDRMYPALGDAGTRGGSISANMALGALVYGRADFRYLGIEKPNIGWVWLFGPDALARYEALEGKPPDFTSHMMPHAQYGMMRTGWEQGDKALLFDCAPWGGGHSHQDRLQVLVYDGRDLLIDSGMYSYDQPLSQTYLRKGVAHNILRIDGQEQLQAEPEVLAWSVTDHVVFGSGQIEQDGLRHQRSVLFVKPDYWVVVDHVFGEGQHDLTRQWHFPLVEAASDEQAAWSNWPDGRNIWVGSPDGAEVRMEKGWKPTGGATAEEGPVAVFANRGQLPVALCSVLVPYEGQAEIPKITALPGDNPLVYRVQIEFADGQVDQIAIASEPGELTIGDHRANGRALCVRKGPRSETVAVVNGDSVSEE